MPRWFIYTLLTMALWGCWGALSKPVSNALSPWQLQTISSLGLLPVIAWLARAKDLRSGSNPSRGFWLGFGSGVLGSLGNVAYYQALAMGGKAAAVTPLTALYPVFTVLLALLILRERLNRVQGAGVVLSVGAMFLFNVGGGSDWVSPWLALALVPLALWGTGALLQKLSTGSASSELATIAFLAGTLPISFLLPLGMPMTWSQPAGTWFLALAVGFTLGLGNVTLVFAYGTGGKASVVTPMAALYSVVTILLAVTILGERLSRREGLGMVLALAAAVALSYETRAVPAVPSASAITKP